MRTKVIKCSNLLIWWQAFALKRDIYEYVMPNHREWIQTVFHFKKNDGILYNAKQ